jgi:hypothetical protein
MQNYPGFTRYFQQQLPDVFGYISGCFLTRNIHLIINHVIPKPP